MDSKSGKGKSEDMRAMMDNEKGEGSRIPDPSKMREWQEWQYQN